MTTTATPEDDGEDFDISKAIEKAQARLTPQQRKAKAALNMIVKGHSWEDVAEVLGYASAEIAQQTYEASLVREFSQDEEMRKRLRAIASRRFDRLLSAVWVKAIDPNNAEQMVAVQRATTIITSHAKLMGLEAPVEVNVNAPTRSELEEWVAGMVGLGNNVIEGNPFGDIEDAEVIEGGDAEWEAEREDPV